MALVQLESDNRGGSGGLQALIAAIDRAASGDAEPDVVIVPGGSDTGGRRVASPVAGQFSTFSETIAWRAREWGVYVVASLHVNVGGKARACCFLFDADGDIVLRTGRKPTECAGESHGGWWHASPVGWIGLFDPPADVSAVGAVDAAVENGLLALSDFKTRGCTQSELKKARERRGYKPPSGATGAFLAVAGWTTASAGDAVGSGAHTFVSGPDGTPLAVADAKDASVLRVELALQPPPNKVELVDR